MQSRGCRLLNRFSTFSRRFFDTAIMAAVSLGTLLVTAQAALKPVHPETGVAVIYAPWTDFDDAFRRAVAAGDPLLTLEAMKMEHIVAAPSAGRVTDILVSPGDQVVRGQALGGVEP